MSKAHSAGSRKNRPTRSIRSQVGEVTATFAQLRDVYASRKNVDDNTLRSWKQTARRRLVGIASATEIALPQQLMTAFDDHSVGPMPIPMAPPDLGALGPRLRPRGFPVNPRSRDAVPPPPTPRNRMLPRRGGL